MHRAADQPTLDELLTRLATDPAGLAVRHLLVLSDLSREEVAQVRLLWPTIPVDRRRTVIRQLGERVAEEDLITAAGAPPARGAGRRRPGGAPAGHRGPGGRRGDSARSGRSAGADSLQRRR
ncbi:MAG: hypothetical protein R2838_15170 [Caldilineaceae bacterium]